ncbi:MAG TPA: PaaI family thioesterase [Thermohalobaculum sp.]|nr:PaaI family thioesterase [Thermohalobaculum sp.]
MNAFAPRDPAYAERVRESFRRQAFMTLLGAEVVSVAPGAVEIALAVRPELGQQHGYVHAGACWSIADSAAGFSAQSLMAAEDGVLTVELKANLLAPAEGTRLIARGRVERAGRRLTVARSDVFAERDGGERHVLTALGTFMAMPGLGDRG